MTDQSNSHRETRLFVLAAAVVIILYGINQAQSVVALFLFSGFLALIGTPPVLWLERKRVPPLLAVMAVIAGMIVLLLIIGTIVGASLSSFSDTLPLYQKRLQEQVLAFKPLLASKNIVITDKVLLEYFNPESIMDLIIHFLTGMGQALSNIILTLLITTFILLEASSFPVKLRTVFGNAHQAFPQVTAFIRDIERYVVLKTLTSLATGTLVGIWLSILGIDFPILWGFLAFLLNYVPNVGSTVAALPAILLALIQFGLGNAVLVAGGYAAINIILDDVIETRLMGRRLGLSTMVVFLSLIFWGSLLGSVGMVLCVPLTMTFKAACENIKGIEWIVVLLGPEPSTKSISTVTKKK